MIIAAGLVPHTPLLLPTLGKNAADALMQTSGAIEKLKESFSAQNLETVVLIKTPERGRRRRTMFQIQLPQNYRVDLSEFGDLVTQGTFVCDTVLGTELKNAARSAHVPLAYIGEEKLEYTASVPLLSLFGRQKVKVIVVQPPDTDGAALYAFGKALTAPLQESHKRVACIATGDCAHCVRKGKKENHEQVCLPFDYMFLDALKKKSTDALLAMRREEISRLNACAVQPALVLRGIIDSLSWNAHLLSYEAPFGVGYTVLEYRL